MSSGLGGWKIEENTDIRILYQQLPSFRQTQNIQNILKLMFQSIGYLIRKCVLILRHLRSGLYNLMYTMCQNKTFEFVVHYVQIPTFLS